MTTSTNYWINRIEEEQAAERKTHRLARFAGIFDLANDKTWRVIMVIMWFVMTAAVVYKTLPGGLAALPMFLILEAFVTTLSVLGWVKVGK